MIDTMQMGAGAKTKYLIYALTDPRTEEARYIGWTSQPRQRLIAHLAEARQYPTRNHKTCWVSSLLRVGVKPTMLVIAEIESAWADAERFWVAFYRAAGCRLTNSADGGEGAPGHVASPETRAKMSAALRGREFSPEHRANISAAKRGHWSPVGVAKTVARNRGRKQSREHAAKAAAARCGLKRSAETRARMSAAQKGRVRSPEHIEKLAATLRGRKHSPEHKAKISAALRGRKRSLEDRAKTSRAIRQWWAIRKADKAHRNG